MMKMTPIAGETDRMSRFYDGRPGGSCRVAAAPLSRIRYAILPVAVLGLLSAGCRILVGAAAVAVGTAGLVGYGVYKTGEAAVTGVGSAVSSVTKGSRSVVFMNGEFKATCDGTVNEVWLASASTFKVSGFEAPTGDRDALSGHLAATTSDDETITLKLEAFGQNQTELRLRIGEAGNLQKSETLYHLIVRQLASDTAARGQLSFPWGHTALDTSFSFHIFP